MRPITSQDYAWVVELRNFRMWEVWYFAKTRKRAREMEKRLIGKKRIRKFVAVEGGR